MQDYFVFICLLIFVVVFIAREVAADNVIKSLQEEKKDLLNRLMARNYNEYAVFDARNHSVAEAEKKSKSIFEEQDVFPVN